MPDHPPRLRVDPRSGDPAAPIDDPSGGRPLNRRLRRWLPLGVLIGIVLGIPLAVAADDWRADVWSALVAFAVAGVLAAAVEDGRVQRRIDAIRRR